MFSVFIYFSRKAYLCSFYGIFQSTFVKQKFYPS